jgi:NAD(P)-dependent dehydrogenase (short-subunit alcohol dehydrogenase family)
MPELTAIRGSLLDLARDPSEAKLAVIADRSAAVSINMRPGTGTELVALLSCLDPAQRAGLAAIGDGGRTVLIAPARTGHPDTRKLVAFSHPEGVLTEIAAYADDVPAEYVGQACPPLPGTRAFPAASPHRALTAQRVLVSASTDALGLAIATAFVTAGASVVFHGRRAAFDLPEAVGDATVGYVSADLAEPAGADYLAEQAAAALGGPVTVLVNNLGPWDGTPVSQVSAQAWRQALQSGLTAQLRLAQLVAPGMREAGHGRIVNITTASTAKRSHGTYGFVKAALAFLTEALAVELAPEITVNSVAPGQIEESVPLMNSLSPAAVPAMLALTPLGRFVTRAELAQAIVTITTSPAFDMMTGATIPLGGGYHLAADEGA